MGMLLSLSFSLYFSEAEHRFHRCEILHTLGGNLLSAFLLLDEVYFHRCKSFHTLGGNATVPFSFLKLSFTFTGVTVFTERFCLELSTCKLVRAFTSVKLEKNSSCLLVSFLSGIAFCALYVCSLIPS